MDSSSADASASARWAHLVRALPWLWLGLSAVWAAVIFVSDQLAWPLALWIATTVGPLTAVQAGRHASAARAEGEGEPIEAADGGAQPADDREEVARRYVQQLRVFNVHAAVFAGTMAVNLVVNLLVNLSAGTARDWSAWWSLWALLGWSAGLAVHGLVVRANRPSLTSSTWEQRQIDRMLGR